jgi:hypothetical protein
MTLLPLFVRCRTQRRSKRNTIWTASAKDDLTGFGGSFFGCSVR